jgi:hypothetical protein
MPASGPEAILQVWLFRCAEQQSGSDRSRAKAAALIMKHHDE